MCLLAMSLDYIHPSFFQNHLSCTESAGYPTESMRPGTQWTEHLSNADLDYRRCFSCIVELISEHIWRALGLVTLSLFWGHNAPRLISKMPMGRWFRSSGSGFANFEAGNQIRSKNQPKPLGFSLWERHQLWLHWNNPQGCSLPDPTYGDRFIQ